MAAPTKTLYVALDAFDPTLARRLIDQGRLPTLGRLFETSAAVDTRPPPGVFVSALWPTVFTALRPDRHGYHCWDEYRPDTYEYRHTTPDEIDGAHFWETLSDAGRRVAVLDVPHTRVRRAINGVQLVEWGCHDRHFGTHSFPDDLVDELAATVGSHPVGTRPPSGSDQFAPCDYAHRSALTRTPTEERALLEDLLAGHQLKRKASTELLSRGGWDMFMTVLGEGHCTGHQLWHVGDPSHPRHDPQVAAQLGHPVQTMYDAIDETLADHLALVDDDTTVFVHLTHGMVPHYDGSHILGMLLHRLERLVDGDPGMGRRASVAHAIRALSPTWGGRAVAAAARAAMRVGIAAAATDDASPVPVAGPDRLWHAAPNNTVSGGVRLNLEGREPCGRIPRADRRRVLDWLAESLLAVVNVDTGEPAVRRVEVTDDLYERRPGDSLPDLFVEWNRRAPIEHVWSPRTGAVRRRYRNWRTGDHDATGLLLVRAPGVSPGAREPEIDAVDIAPTVAATLDVDLPGVDGYARSDLLPASAPRAGARRPPLAAPWARADGMAVAERMRARLDGVLAAHHVTRTATDEAIRRTDILIAEGAWMRERLVAAHDRAERLERIVAGDAWLEHLPAVDGALISVVIPTRNRAHLVQQAIGSVIAQSNERWEALVVDDHSDDETWDVINAWSDPRVRPLRADGRGCTAARNVALDAASGDIITYLDDDNRLARHWLKAVAWFFANMPSAQVAYGARIVDDFDWLVHKRERTGIPGLHFEPWDRDTLEAGNIADMNVLAHRRSNIRFDEAVDYYGDWDLFLRLTEETPPVPLPVVAAMYTTGADRRMSGGDEAERHRQFLYIREKVRRARSS